MDTLRTLRVWAAAAWADGELHPFEEAALRRLIAMNDALSPEERREAATFLTTAPRVDPAEVRSLPPDSREGVFRAAVAIVRIDDKVTDEERQFLDRLRAALDLDEATAARIERRQTG